jgi:hypothetical protein
MKNDILKMLKELQNYLKINYSSDESIKQQPSREFLMIYEARLYIRLWTDSRTSGRIKYDFKSRLLSMKKWKDKITG